MNKNTIFIFIVLFVFMFIITSCKDKYNVFDFNVTECQKIKIEYNDRNYDLFSIQFKNIDTLSVMILNVSEEKLSFYNIKSGCKIYEIFVDTSKKIHNFNYINKDSIFVFVYNKNRIPFSEQQYQLQRINYEGKILYTYEFMIGSTLLNNKKINISDILPPRIAGSNLMMCGYNAIFIPLYLFKSEIGTKEFIENRFPVLMRYNTLTKQMHVSEQNSVPYIKEGIYYPSNHNFDAYCISYTEKPLIRYFYSSDVFEWDFINDKIQSYSIKTKLIDTIEPLPIPTSYAKNNIRAFYGDMFCDSDEKLLFSNIYFDNSFYGVDKNKRTICSTIIANENYEYLGEIYCPPYFIWGKLDKKYISINPINDSLIELKFAKLIKTKSNFNKYMDSCKNDLQCKRMKTLDLKKIYDKKNYIFDFIKSQKRITNDNYTIVTIYLQGGCINCNESVLGAIQQNKNILDKLNFYVILSCNDIKFTIEQLEKYKLKDMANVVLDTAGIIDKVTNINYLHNPRLTIIYNNDIILDSIWDSTTIENEFVPMMFQSAGLIFKN